MLKPWIIVIEKDNGEILSYTGFNLNEKIKVIGIATKVGWEFDVEHESY